MADFRAVGPVIYIVVVVIAHERHRALFSGDELGRRGVEGIGGREPGGGSGEDSLTVGLVDADDKGVNEAELVAGLIQLVLVVARLWAKLWIDDAAREGVERRVKPGDSRNRLWCGRLSPPSLPPSESESPSSRVVPVSSISFTHSSGTDGDEADLSEATLALRDTRFIPCTLGTSESAVSVLSPAVFSCPDRPKLAVRFINEG